MNEKLSVYCQTETCLNGTEEALKKTNNCQTVETKKSKGIKLKLLQNYSSWLNKSKKYHSIGIYQ